jgi:ATP-dependent Clp protease adaptor protein ClpS
MSDVEVKQQLRPILNELEPPKDYKVIYLNDNVTTFEFVTESLVGTFSYEPSDADNKAMEINEKGAGIVALLPFEVAEQKGVEVLLTARNQGYPLEIKLESN